MPPLHLKNCQKNSKHISAFSGEHKVNECVFFTGCFDRSFAHAQVLKMCVECAKNKLQSLRTGGMKKGVNFGVFRDQYTTSAYIFSRQLTFPELPSL